MLSAHDHLEAVQIIGRFLVFSTLDYGIGPFLDTFSEMQHKFGPYKPIIKTGESIICRMRSRGLENTRQAFIA